MRASLTSTTTRLGHHRPRPSRSVQVPTSIVGPILAMVASQHGITPAELGARADIHPRTVFAIIRQERRTTSLALIDALLTRMGEQHRWHDEPLRVLYLPDDGGRGA